MTTKQVDLRCLDFCKLFGLRDSDRDFILDASLFTGQIDTLREWKKVFSSNFTYIFALENTC